MFANVFFFVSMLCKNALSYKKGMDCFYPGAMERATHASARHPVRTYVQQSAPGKFGRPVFYLLLSKEKKSGLQVIEIKFLFLVQRRFWSTQMEDVRGRKPESKGPR